jgi:hypothetical protein
MRERGQARLAHLHLQFNRLHLGERSGSFIAEERGDYTKDGIAEAADVQDVRTVRRLRRRVRLQVDAHQLRACVVASLQADRVLDEISPRRHRQAKSR